MCLYLCVAIDIDAVGLESEEPEPPPPPPPQQRSPKASPNQVISTLTREKRMPFFKKVTQEAGPPVFSHSSVRLYVSPAPRGLRPPVCPCNTSVCMTAREQ